MNTIGLHNSFIGSYNVDSLLCDDIIEEFESSKSSEYITKGGINRDNKQTIDHSIKESFDLNFMYMSDSIKAQYINHLIDSLDQYLKYYKYADIGQEIFRAYEDQINVQKYPPGGGYKAWHFENSGNIFNISRHLVFMTYLNDVVDGGTEFYYQNVRTQAKKGSTIIWPATWTHTHRGVVSNQTKYIITGWFYFEGIYEKTLQQN